MLKQSMIIWLLLLTGACAMNNSWRVAPPVQTKQLTTLSEGKSGIYVYRLNQRRDAGFVTNIWIDGKCMGTSVGDSMFYAEVDANREHLVGAGYDAPHDLLTVATEQGKNHFVAHDIQTWGVGKVNQLQLVEPVMGEAAIVDLNVAENNNHCSQPSSTIS